MKKEEAATAILDSLFTEFLLSLWGPANHPGETDHDGIEL